MAESPGYLGRVLAPDENPRGTCFRVSSNVPVTAWHVLEAIGAADVGSTVSVDPLGARGAPAVAKVHAVDAHHDVAVLLNTGTLPECAPGLIASNSVQPRTDVLITGVPQFADRHQYRLTNATGEWLGTAERDDRLVLGQIEASAVVPGMSCGPVRRLRDDLIVGIVRDRYNSPDQWMRNTVWCARTEDVIPLLEGVANDIVLLHAASSKDEEREPLTLGPLHVGLRVCNDRGYQVYKRRTSSAPRPGWGREHQLRHHESW